jgi:hypothetical protein
VNEEKEEKEKGRRKIVLCLPPISTFSHILSLSLLSFSFYDIFV